MYIILTYGKAMFLNMYIEKKNYYNIKCNNTI